MFGVGRRLKIASNIDPCNIFYWHVPGGGADSFGGAMAMPYRVRNFVSRKNNGQLLSFAHLPTGARCHGPDHRSALYPISLTSERNRIGRRNKQHQQQQQQKRSGMSIEWRGSITTSHTHHLIIIIIVVARRKAHRLSQPSIIQSINLIRGIGNIIDGGISLSPRVYYTYTTVQFIRFSRRIQLKLIIQLEKLCENWHVAPPCRHKHTHTEPNTRLLEPEWKTRQKKTTHV